MKEEELLNIIERINTGKCVVVIGPHLMAQDGSNILTKLNETLVSQLDKLTYYKEADLLGIDSKTRNNFLKPKLKAFFEEEASKPNNLYELLAEIPFSLVINTSPDKTLFKFMVDKDIVPSYSYYHKGKPVEEYEHNFQLIEESDTTITTHIFNIFGDYNYHDSLILTFKDLYDYLHSIMHSYQLDEEIKIKIYEAKAVLFFGCSFDKWYFQLFFQLFLQIMEVDEDDVLNSHKINQPNTKNFFMNEFHMEFFEDDAAGAIKELNQAVKSGKITREKKDAFDGPPPKVFISYKWGGESEVLANELKERLTEKGIVVKIDKEELAYKGEIEEFEKYIGQADSILVVLSNAYMESAHCMFELSEIYNNGNFKERIFPLVLKDAQTFEADDLDKYKEYWVLKMQTITKKMSEDVSKMPTYMKDLNKYQQILNDFDAMTGILRNLNLGDVSEHRKSNFEVISKQIKKSHRDLLRKAN